MMSMKAVSRLHSSFLLLMMTAVCVSCAGVHQVRSERAATLDLSTTYTLILYGCNYHNDLETIAIFDRERDGYTFVPYAPAFQYRLVKGISSDEAFRVGMEFVDCNASFQNVLLSRLLDGHGNTLGFELRPLYLSLTYGVQDVLDSSYFIEGDKVRATIRLLPAVERMFSTGDDTDDRHR